MNHDTVSPRLFGRVQGHIGTIDERRYIRITLRECRYPDAYGYGNSPIIGLERGYPSLFAKALGQTLGALQIRFRKQDDKLIAAPPSQKVNLADHRAQTPNHLLYDAIADQVPKSIIDALEMVNINHQQRYRMTKAVRTHEFCLRACEKCLTVVDAC